MGEGPGNPRFVALHRRRRRPRRGDLKRLMLKILSLNPKDNVYVIFDNFCPSVPMSIFLGGGGRRRRCDDDDATTRQI